MRTPLALIFIALSLCAAQKSAAQETAVQADTSAIPRNAVVYHNEFFAGYGILTTNDILVPLFETLFSGGDYRMTRINGSFLAGYKYRFDKVASLGATYAIGKMDGEIENDENSSLSEYSGSHHTLAVECDLRYMTRRIVTLYSTIGVGATFANRVITPVDPAGLKYKEPFGHINFQLTMIGVKVGTYRAGAFFEYGTGYKGVFNFGAYARF